jgi:CBS-domain-containing membrane protein
MGKIKDFLSSQIPGGNKQVEGKYIFFQCLLVVISLGLFLMLLEFFGGIIVASLGASSFILFATPHTNSSKAANLIGSYIFGAFSGIIFSFLHSYLLSLDYEAVHVIMIFACSCAAALTTFLMVKTGLVHPPAAALAVGLSVDPRCLQTGAAAVAGVIILCSVRYLLRNHVKNLV